MNTTKQTSNDTRDTTGNIIGPGSYGYHACDQCDKPMNPVEWILGPVCGKCCRANHRRVIGK